MRYRLWRIGVFLDTSVPPLYWLYCAEGKEKEKRE